MLEGRLPIDVLDGVEGIFSLEDDASLPVAVLVVGRTVASD